MTFSAVLNEYMAGYGLSVTALSATSELSKATISRFKSGKQEPSADSDTVSKLAMGIALASKNCWNPGDYTQILERLKAGLKSDAGDFAPIAANLNLMISLLNINVNDLSRHLKFDASYLSRIRSGQRKPANVPAFCEGTADFISAKYSLSETEKLSEILNIKADKVADIVECREAVRRWLTDNNQNTESIIKPFLKRLDTFSPDELKKLYDKAASGSVMEYGIPIAARFSTARNYFGDADRDRARMEWLKIAAISDSKEPVIIYSDFPESETDKKFMEGLLKILGKGVPIKLIHDFDSSFYDMAELLEKMVPFYLSGLVDSRYFKRRNDKVFNNLIHVSGTVGLSAEAVEGCPDNGKTTLTTVKDEVGYLRRRGNDLLGKTFPVLEVYPESRADEYMSDVLLPFGGNGGSIRSILPCPPLYTASSDLIKEVCAQNGIGKNDIMLVLQYAAQLRSKVIGGSGSRSVEDIFPELSREEFESAPLALPLADLFMNRPLSYTYEQYTRHIEETKGFADKNPNYCCSVAAEQTYKNLCVRICTGEYAILSLNRVPVTHIVVRHPKLLRALENMTITGA